MGNPDEFEIEFDTETGEVVSIAYTDKDGEAMNFELVESIEEGENDKG